MGTKWGQESKSGNKRGTKWEQSGAKNPKVGTREEQSGNKGEQSGAKNPKVRRSYERMPKTMGSAANSKKFQLHPWTHPIKP